LEDYFPIGKVTIQGRTVKLPVGYPFKTPLGRRIFLPKCSLSGDVSFFERGELSRFSSWWLSFNPFEKYATAKVDHSLKV